MEIKSKNDYINLGINISNTVRSTLGPKGMNKMIILKEGPILTNDGATIIRNVNFGNPIGDLFKRLAESQEKAIGDGTTTAVLIAGQLLENALELLNKNVHKTTIITGYQIARSEVIKYLSDNGIDVQKEMIMRTTLGSKLNPQLSEGLIRLLIDIEPKRLRIAKLDNRNFEDTKLIKGFLFGGHTINDRVPNQAKGKIAVLDLQANVDFAKFNISQTEELDKLENRQRDYRKQIVNKLKEADVSVVFFSDTNPQFENYLIEANIMAIPVFRRDQLDNICRAVQAKAIGDPYVEFKDYLGEGEVNYNQMESLIEIIGNSEIDTLVLCGPTKQTVEEAERAVNDVLGVIRNFGKAVIGAGAIEVDLALHLRQTATKIGGKEQAVIEKFAEALESIPLILAENCGHDAVEALSILKSEHSKGNKQIGIDPFRIVSDAEKRGIFEEASLKIYAINSATEVANLILKLDDIYNGE